MQLKKYVLYAEDDEDDRAMMEETIAEHPEFTLLTFGNGVELLNHLQEVKKEEVCLVVLDLNMPELNGIETLKTLREDSVMKDLPVVIFTTSNSQQNKVQAEALHARFITKPMSIEHMKMITADMMEYSANHPRWN